MLPDTQKRLLQSVQRLMGLVKAERNDPSAAAAIEAELETLGARSGRAVALTFLEWHRTGSIARDPRPADARPVPSMPTDPPHLTFI